jgi:hypothetical protein
MPECDVQVHKTRAKVQRTYDTDHGPLALRYTTKDLRRGDSQAPKANQQLAAWYSSLSSTMQDAVQQPANGSRQLSLQMLLADPRRIPALDPDMLGTPEGRERISASVTAVLERALTRRSREAARRREEENAIEEEAARAAEEQMPALQRAPKRTGPEAETRRANVAESVGDDEDDEDDDWMDQEEEDDEEEGGKRKRRRANRRPLADRNYDAARPLLYSGTPIPSTRSTAASSTTERVRDFATSASPRPSPPELTLPSQSPSAQPNSVTPSTSATPTIASRRQRTPQTPMGSPAPRRPPPLPAGRLTQPRSKQEHSGGTAANRLCSNDTVREY